MPWQIDRYFLVLIESFRIRIVVLVVDMQEVVTENDAVYKKMGLKVILESNEGTY